MDVGLILFDPPQWRKKKSKSSHRRRRRARNYFQFVHRLFDFISIWGFARKPRTLWVNFAYLLCHPRMMRQAYKNDEAYEEGSREMISQPPLKIQAHQLSSRSSFAIDLQCFFLLIHYVTRAIFIIIHFRCEQHIKCNKTMAIALFIAGTTELAQLPPSETYQMHFHDALIAQKSFSPEIEFSKLQSFWWFFWLSTGWRRRSREQTTEKKGSETHTTSRTWISNFYVAPRFLLMFYAFNRERKARLVHNHPAPGNADR